MPALSSSGHVATTVRLRERVHVGQVGPPIRSAQPSRIRHAPCFIEHPPVCYHDRRWDPHTSLWREERILEEAT
jgi:hypothetical protein